MAITPNVEAIGRMASGNFWLAYGTVLLDSSYVTNGEAFAITEPHAVEHVGLGFAFGAGYFGEIVPSTQKLKVYNVAAHAHDLLIKGGQAAASTAALAWYATDILGKEAATDKTILGSASATKGGVLSQAAAALSEVANGTDLSSVTMSWFAFCQ